MRLLIWAWTTAVALLLLLAAAAEWDTHGRHLLDNASVAAVAGPKPASSSGVLPVPPGKVVILYVFIVVDAVCDRGLPQYMKVSLEQAIFANPDCLVYLASNFGACKHIEAVADSVKHLRKVDASAIESNRTRMFKNQSASMFMADHFSELWVTSAQRFFLIEDAMLHMGIHEVVHVEGDNLLYGPFSSIVPTLRSGYPGLAATPLNAPKQTFITASVFWISSRQAIHELNNFFLDLGQQNATWRSYLLWLVKHGGSKPGFGVDAMSREIGVKPFAINEMSILAFYREQNESALHNLPVAPRHNYYVNRYVCDMNDFAPGGSKAGPPLGLGIFDPNSWGQFLGGTHDRHGRNKRFTDPSHIIGQAIRLNPSCLPVRGMVVVFFADRGCRRTLIIPPPHVKQEMRCSNYTMPGTAPGSTSCYTAPFVRCNSTQPWTPIWNLHVHSKHTHDFRSAACVCGS